MLSHTFNTCFLYFYDIINGGDNMDGILVIHKEAGMTSHDVVMRLRRILHIKKIGHSGTLDPQATGVLLVLVGRACKALPYLEDTDKEYVATMKLGQRTFTDDIWGDVLEERDITPMTDFKGILSSFTGVIKQVPPMISSVRVNGKKLYEYARANEEVERPVREVTIYESEVLDEEAMKFRVACSSGTYIRTLCVDIAQKSGNLGCMSSLVRTAVGRFTLEQSVTLAQVEAGEFTLHSLMDVFHHQEKIEYEPIQEVLHGKKILLDTTNDEVVITHQQEVIAVYQRVKDRLFRCARGLW